MSLGVEGIGKRLANLLVWFDSEWGFASRMLDIAACWRQGFAVGG